MPRVIRASLVLGLRLLTAGPLRGDLLLLRHSAERGLHGVAYARQALGALTHEALDALEEMRWVEVAFGYDLVDAAAGAPAIVPVRCERVLRDDRVIDPVGHHAARAIADDHRVDALGGRRDGVAIRLRLQRVELRTDGGDDLHV